MPPKSKLKRKSDGKGDSKPSKWSKDDLKPTVSTSSSKKESADDGDFVWTSPQSDLHVCKYLNGGESSSMIASFDLDGTLVSTKTDSPFPKDPDDFKLISDKLSPLIKQYIDSGHRFVLFTNQLGVSNKKVTIEEVQKRVQNVFIELDPKKELPCLILVATGDDIYRKPRPGMWWALEKVYNKDIQINRSQCFYVGDAAGRVHEQKGSKKVKKDHSASDLLFARNLNISFVTPEQFLKASPDEIIDVGEENEESLKVKTYNPKDSLPENANFGQEIIKKETIKDEQEFLDKINGITSLKPIIVIMTGLPGSGKTQLYENVLKTSSHKFIKVSRDVVGTTEKCEKLIENHLKDGGVNICIDNTSVDVDSRKKWINLCKRYNCTIVSVYINVDVKRALHNNVFRRCHHDYKTYFGDKNKTDAKTDAKAKDDKKAKDVDKRDAKAKDTKKPAKDTKKGPVSVPSMVIYKLNKDLVVPTKEERFDLIFHLNFVPKFEDKFAENLYFMYLNEKLNQ